MTNTDAPEYARQHSDEFPAEEAKKVTEITENVRRKFAKGGTWQNRGRPGSISTSPNGRGSSGVTEERGGGGRWSAGPFSSCRSRWWRCSCWRRSG